MNGKGDKVSLKFINENYRNNYDEINWNKAETSDEYAERLHKEAKDMPLPRVQSTQKGGKVE